MVCVGSHTLVFHQLLDTFEQLQHQQQAQPQQGFEVIRWFTTEIDSLRAQIFQLEQERDSLQAAQLSSDQLATLQAENAQLKEQLQNTQFRLDSIHQLLGRTPDATTSPVTSTTPATLSTPTAESPATAAAPAPKPAKSSRSRQGDTAQKIHQLVDAIINWNSSQQDSQRRLRLSIPPVKALASAIGANYQATIQQVLKERESELNELHARLMLGFRHNATVPHKQQLLQAIAKDFLQLETWADVHYSG